MAKKSKRVPAADSVMWAGLCTCGCGAFKAVLMDQNDNPIASFGWDEDGWINFMAGVARQLKGESMDDLVCEHHTAH